MNKVTDRVEKIFAHAVAMEQTGRLKNTIYVVGKEIFIMNFDNTLLLRFPLRESEAPFSHPVSFRASDYDSKRFEEKGGKVIFSTEKNGFIKEKRCSAPGSTPEEIKAVFERYSNLKENRITLNRSILELLDTNLSHIEFWSEGRELRITQRNIFDGSVIELKRSGGEGFGALVSGEDEISRDFGPVGIRTPDFEALFLFTPSIQISFGTEEDEYAYLQGLDSKTKMRGILSTCVYDEMGEIRQSRRKGDKDGRKKQKDWAGEQEVDGTSDERKRGEKVRRSRNGKKTKK